MMVNMWRQRRDGADGLYLKKTRMKNEKISFRFEINRFIQVEIMCGDTNRIVECLFRHCVLADVLYLKTETLTDGLYIIWSSS